MDVIKKVKGIRDGTKFRRDVWIANPGRNMYVFAILPADGFVQNLLIVVSHDRPRDNDKEMITRDNYS